MTAHRDEQARSLAATTFDRNVVVNASAGTGKTTLLITRLAHLIVKSPDPVPLPQIVALTFMNKAANEIKIRLRECLECLTASSNATASGDLWDRYRLSAADLMGHYHISSDELQRRAEAALHDLENSQIGTIHSFAAHLLRLYPLEAGVDPGFKPDEEFAFEEHFTREWAVWLDEELGVRGARHALWTTVLRSADLEALQTFAKALVNDLIPLPAIKTSTSGNGLGEAIRSWLQEKQRQAQALCGAHPPDQRKSLRNVEKLLVAAEHTFRHILNRGDSAFRELDDEPSLCLEQKDAGSKPPAGWAEEEFAEAAGLIKTAKVLLAVDHAYFENLLVLLAPFAERCRRGFLEAGLVTFDGLLARARNLLRDHPEVRKRLKRQFRAILVDEFQDTDPVQYEILLFLAEEPEQAVRDWKQIRLQPGKLFIVGDPKQSIFAFRRADIEAFQAVTTRVLEQGGLPLTLTRNFRSHPTILSTVNGVFDRLIQERPGLQPKYVPLEPDPNRKTAADTQGVELRLVAPSGTGEEEDILNAEQAVEAEAEAIARWLKTDVIGKGMLTDRDGRRRKVEPGDVAILFRTFSQSWEYLGALRRHGLSYVAEGEKHFYQRQEVIDLVNLLRCIQHPHDQVALLGLLRSAVGGLTDRHVMDLATRGPLDYRKTGAVRLAAHPKASHLQRLYAVLESLHRDCPLRPLPDALDLIFERLPVLELAGASLHGEQAVANLWKVRALAEDLASDSHLTLAGFVELLKGRIADPPDESESGLAEETSREAIRVMSMHKAKGLEFPIVVLVGLQTGPKTQRDPIQVRQDWSTGVLGFRLGDHCTLGGVYVAEKLDARETAERRRLLYVGMTRAKERLVLSGALTRYQTPGNFLALLREGIGGSVGRSEAATLAVGEGRIAQTIIPADEVQPADKRRRKKSSEPVFDLKSFETRWRTRAERWNSYRQRAVFLTPSMLEGYPQGSVQSASHSEVEGGLAMAIGSLVHKALECWNYRDKIEVLLEQFEQGVNHWIAEAFQESSAEITTEARDVLKAFARSEAYAELRDATILGREVPFIMSWQPPPAMVGVGGAPLVGPPPTLMEGRIDLLYEKDGGLWVADYKTDRITEAEVAERMETYRPQAQAYTEAVRQAVGRNPAGFTFIFLRLGKSVPIHL